MGPGTLQLILNRIVAGPGTELQRRGRLIRKRSVHAVRVKTKARVHAVRVQTKARVKTKARVS